MSLVSTPVERIKTGLRRRIPGGGEPAGGRTAEQRLAELTALENGWRSAPVRDERINEHLIGLVRRAGITGGSVLEIGGRMHPRGHAFGPAFSYVNLDLVHSDENTIVGDITNCPEIADGTYDVVLSVDVFEHIDRPWLAAAEIARILKPGGRLAVSDIALKNELPQAVASSLAAYVGCIAGALPIDTYRNELLNAGFEHVQIVDSGSDLNAYKKVENQSGCCSPAMDSSCCSPASPTLHEELSSLLDTYDVNQAAASVKIYAIKPSDTCCKPGCCS